jgi:hypothetical protein
MTRVFIGGSRAIKQLSASLLARLDNIIVNGHQVLLGDASGVDKLVQTYFAENGYRDVVVYCTGNTCRNNVGHWDIQKVAANGIHGGFAFYALKDLQMAQEAEYGFMLWDLKSNGTLNNLLNLLEQDKKSLVWLSPEDTFYAIRQEQDLLNLLGKCAATDLAKFEAKLNLSKRIASIPSKLAFV